MSDSNYLIHWKYTKREKVNGKWRYWYDDVKNKVTSATKTAVDNTKEKLAAKTTETADKSVDAALKTANKAAGALDGIVDKTRDTLNRLYDNPNNIYNITPGSYDEKIAKVKETPEWKNIVARGDPEYVKKAADGSTTYLIDKYAVDKKHPVLDAIGDIAMGRNVDVNEITKESTVAGIKDYVSGAISTGIIAAGAITTILQEKFKLQQGSYNDEISDLITNVDRGSTFVNELVDSAQNVTDEDIAKLARTMATSAEVAKVQKAFREDNVVTAAKLIVESDTVKNAYGNSEYYKQAEQALTGLSPEEIAAINLLLKEMRKS